MNPFAHFGRLLARGVTPEQLPFFSGASTLQQEALLRDLLREKRRQNDLDTPLRQLETVSLDTETTGFYPEQGDEIISLAAVPMKGPEIDRDHAFVKLVKPRFSIPENITRLTGISHGDVVDAPPIDEVLKTFLHWMGARTIVGYYLGHDLTFINHHLVQRYGYRLNNRSLELMRVVRFLFPELNCSDLDSVFQTLQIPSLQRHTADGDAHMTAILWTLLLQECQARGIETLRELFGHLSR